MCLAVAGRIQEVMGASAKVDVQGVAALVNVQLIDNPKTDDYVLIHAGCAIEKVSCSYAVELEAIYREWEEHDA